MPGRSGRDEKQDAPEPGSFSSVMHQFGKSLGLIHDPDPDPAPPTSTTPPKTPTSKGTDALIDRTKNIDAAVDEASK